MEHKVGLEGAVSFTKFSVRLVCTWPPPRLANQRRIVLENVAWCLSFISVFCLFIPLLVSVHEYSSDSIILTQSLCFCSACATIIVKTLILRVNRGELQILVDEMEEFIKCPEPRERLILQNYVNSCWIFHGVITLMNYLASIPVILGPFIFPEQRMPTFAVYPFSIDSKLATCLVFLHQCFVGLQSSAAITIDCQLALMMWYAGARLEILAEDIARNDKLGRKKFHFFVQKHQRLLSYATKVAETMRYVSLTTTCVCGVASIMCCMQFVGNQSTMVKMQFAPVTIVGLVNLLVSAWPTENMIRVCELIGKAVYDSSWDEMSPKMAKDIIMVLQASQRPVQVSIRGFLPALSFQFYGSFLSGVFSYFTTIRIIMSDDEKLPDS